MQEYWLALTLLVTISIGIVAFINKIFAERKYNVQLSLLVLYAIMLFIAVLVWFFQWFISLKDIGFTNIFWCILWWTQFYWYSFVMMNALRYLPTSTYFISVRLSSSFVLLAIGILFFWDIVTSKEILGFVLWVWAMILLFENKWEKITNIKKGVFFLIVWIFCLVFWHTITKVLSFEINQVPTLLTIAFWSALLTAIIFWYKHIFQNLKDLRPIFTINLVQSFFFFIYFYFLFQVYNLGDLGVSYKIQSYSPFIPIILAAIIYREKVSIKQWIWILLTGLSLYFFT